MSLWTLSERVVMSTILSIGAVVFPWAAATISGRCTFCTGLVLCYVLHVVCKIGLENND